jgi:hypothetical protein
MKTKKLILLALLGGGLIGLYYAGAPATPPAAAADRGLRHTAVAAPGRLLHGAGVTGSKIVAPAVRKLVTETEAELVLLRQELRTFKGTVTHSTTARDGARRVQQMDSTALAHLAAGKPAQAFKLAMQANGLVAAVRDNLRAQ